MNKISTADQRALLTRLADRIFGLDDLHPMLSECDAVVIAAPATPRTPHLIHAPALARAAASIRC